VNGYSRQVTFSTRCKRGHPSRMSGKKERAREAGVVAAGAAAGAAVVSLYQWFNRPAAVPQPNPRPVPNPPPVPPPGPAPQDRASAGIVLLQSHVRRRIAVNRFRACLRNPTGDQIGRARGRRRANEGKVRENDEYGQRSRGLQFLRGESGWTVHASYRRKAGAGSGVRARATGRRKRAKAAP
jgi:hypothetical protein